MKPSTQIEISARQELPYRCSACGADRGCDCNAPAVAKLAKKAEQDRQNMRAYRQRKKAALDNADVENTKELSADPEVERDRKDCIALFEKVKAAEAEREAFGNGHCTAHNPGGIRGAGAI